MKFPQALFQRHCPIRLRQARTASSFEKAHGIPQLQISILLHLDDQVLSRPLSCHIIMPLELHVWGPAFGLPSIDAECLAAISYLRSAEEISPQLDWALIASHDPSTSPSRDFPLLVDGSKHVGGYDRIMDHLRIHHGVNLDEGLSPSQRADRIAFAALHRTRALPLLDVAFYTSFSNNYHNTRPAFTALLPWHANLIVPPSRRAAALARTQHLGLQSLDLDTVHRSSDTGTSGVAASYQAAKRAAGIGAAAPKTAEGVSSLGSNPGVIAGMLRQPEQAARFKLDALCAAFLEPLEELLAGQEFCLGTRRQTSLDCLSLGYLALMVYPTLQQPWLADTIMAKFTTIERYTRRLKTQIFGSDVAVSDVLSLNTVPRADIKAVQQAQKRANLVLPWTPPPEQSAMSVFSGIGREILDSVPGIRSVHPTALLPASKQGGGSQSTDVSESPSLLSVSITGILATAAVLGGIAFYHFQPRFGEREQVFTADRPAEVVDRGEAGAMLAALDGWMRAESNAFEGLRSADSANSSAATPAEDIGHEVAA